MIGQSQPLENDQPIEAKPAYGIFANQKYFQTSHE